MPELFWIIVGYTVVLTLCFLLGEYLQTRRTTKKHKAICKENPACPLEESQHFCDYTEEQPTHNEAPSDP